MREAPPPISPNHWGWQFPVAAELCPSLPVPLDIHGSSFPQLHLQFCPHQVPGLTPNFLLGPRSASCMFQLVPSHSVTWWGGLQAGQEMEHALSMLGTTLLPFGYQQGSRASWRLNPQPQVGQSNLLVLKLLHWRAWLDLTAEDSLFSIRR